MANTKSIESTQVKSLPYFPELTGGKTTRVVTKHFTNCAMYLPSSEFALLSWLIYQSKSDNTIVYSTRLLISFKETVLAANVVYNPSIKLSGNVKSIREDFKHLIENGYLLPNYDKKVFTINPMLSYHPEYLSAANYKSICAEYKELWDKPKNWTEAVNSDFKVIDAFAKLFTKRYSETINSVIKKKIAK